jgi:hypothetical protein
VCNIEFNRPNATRFEVDEDQTTRGPEQVSRMRFSVQQLLGGHAVPNCLTRAAERAQEELPVALNQRGGVVPIRNQTLSRRGSFRKMRRFDRDAPHPGMQAPERICVTDW